MAPGGDPDPKAGAGPDLERLLPLSRLADIGRLAASVAHEISTPLASITLRAESLARSAQDPRLQAIESFKNFPRYLKSIEEEALRCKEILARLMDFARAPAEEPKSVDLNALAERAGQLMRHEMMRRRVSLDFRPQPDLPRPEGWEGRIGQAVLALLLCALDGAAEGGTVTLETSARGPDAAGVRVGPVGAGGSLEETLSVCRAVAATHGGDASLESDPGGTRIALVLPLRRPAC
jgi:signal transduction histidine kinase